MLFPCRVVPESTLAIVGAGPVGLEAAAWATSRNWNFVLFEKAEVGNHVRQWGHVRLFSPFEMNRSPWGLQFLSEGFPDLELPPPSAYVTGHEYLRSYLEPLARLPLLKDRIFLGAEVLEIGKEKIGKKDRIGQASRLQMPFRLLLRLSDGTEIIHRSQAVIDASGVYSTPQALGSGNIAAPGEREALAQAPDRFRFELVDILGRERERFAGRRILLVGGGHSAATALETLSRLAQDTPATRVTWINRSEHPEPYALFENDPLPYRDRLSRLANALALAPPDWLAYYGGSSLEAIRSWPRNGRGEFKADVLTPRGIQAMAADQILANVGFRPDNSIYRQLQVHECYATWGPIKLSAVLLGGSGDCLAQQSQGLDTLKNPEPGFFILGNKSYGTNSTFLLRHGLEQVETVMRYLGESLA